MAGWQGGVTVELAYGVAALVVLCWCVLMALRWRAESPDKPPYPR